jgi:hypothetical protein
VEAAYRATYNFIRTHIRELIQAILGRSFE